MKANAVTVINDDSQYTAPQQPLLLKSLKSHNISVLQQLDIPSREDRYSQFIDVIIEDLHEAIFRNRTLTLIFLAHRKTVSKVISDIKTKAADLEPCSIMVLTSSQGCLMNIEPDWSEEGINVIKVCQTTEKIEELEQYFSGLEFWNNDGEPLNLIISSALLKYARCRNKDSFCFTELLHERAAIGRPFSTYNHRIFYTLTTTLTVLKSFQTDEKELSNLRRLANKTDSLQPRDSDVFMTKFKNISNNTKFGLKFYKDSPIPHPTVDVIYNDELPNKWTEDKGNEEFKASLKSCVKLMVQTLPSFLVLINSISIQQQKICILSSKIPTF